MSQWIIETLSPKKLEQCGKPDYTFSNGRYKDWDFDHGEKISIDVQS